MKIRPLTIYKNFLKFKEKIDIKSKILLLSVHQSAETLLRKVLKDV